MFTIAFRTYPSSALGVLDPVPRLVRLGQRCLDEILRVGPVAGQQVGSAQQRAAPASHVLLEAAVPVGQVIAAAAVSPDSAGLRRPLLTACSRSRLALTRPVSSVCRAGRRGPPSVRDSVTQ